MTKTYIMAPGARLDVGPRGHLIEQMGSVQSRPLAMRSRRRRNALGDVYTRFYDASGKATGDRHCASSSDAEETACNRAAMASKPAGGSLESQEGPFDSWPYPTTEAFVPPGGKITTTVPGIAAVASRSTMLTTPVIAAAAVAAVAAIYFLGKKRR